MGTASAKPEKLQAFVGAAAEIRGELSSRIGELRASYDRFQSSGSSAVGNADLMGVELPGLLTAYANDEAFVKIVRQAFVDADGTVTGDGRVVVDAAAFSAAFDAAATRAGFDPLALVADRPAVTVDVPVAAGTPPTSGFVADPVCTATGHFLEVEDDLVWPDRLDVLRWRRTYSSRFVAAGPFGRGWASWASVALVEAADGTVGYQGPDGQMAVFVPDHGRDATADGSAGAGAGARDGGAGEPDRADGGAGERDAADGVGAGGGAGSDDPPGGYGRVPGVQATLARRAEGDGGGWELRWDRGSVRPGAVWSFDGDGLVRSVSDPASGTVTFGYTGGLLVSVSHVGGRRLELEWDGARVVALRSSCGRVARYRYDAAGDLAGTDRVLGARRYETDGAGRVVEVWDADGVRLCRNTYDGEGRVVAQVSPFGRETTFAYHPGNRTVVADTEGGPVSIFEHDQAGRLTGLVDHQGHQMRRRFDPEGRCVEATGFDGATSRQDFAPDGLSASRTGSGGAVERWDYDDHGRVTAHEVEGGPRVEFVYEGDSPFPARLSGPEGWHIAVDTTESGLVRALTDADGVTVTFDHDGDGNVVATGNALGAVTRTEPHVSGMAARTTMPDGAVYEFDRDDAGRMLGLRTPLGHHYTLEWTPAGRLKGLVDPDDGHTSFEHGTNGAMERVIDALGAELDLSYDHLERLVGLSAPGGAKWDFAYTATGMLSLVHDPAGGTWGYDYDPEGRMVAATDPLGHQVHQRYDQAGRLAEVVDQSGNVTRYTRDALGRITAEHRPEGATTAYAWDTWGRPTEVRFPDGDSLTYTYTPAGRVRSVTTAEGRGWTSTYDTAGRLATVTDTAGATTHFAWDSCDRLVETTSPAGVSHRMRYDAHGRLVETTRAGRTWTASYDHAGRVTAKTDPLGATTRYRYDLRGKLVAAVDPLGNQVRVRYDERGNAVAVLDPLGGLTATTYDAMRRPVAITDQLGRVTRIARDAKGRVVRRELPTGDVLEWRRDARGLATDVVVNGRDTVVFDHDGAGRPVLVHEPARNRTFTLGWTRGGRLASLDVDGAAMRWERDRDGLVTSRRDSAGRPTSYTHDTAGRLATVSSDRWGTIELDRDPDGRLVALRADGVTRRWDRDAGGLVAAFHQSGPDGDATTSLVRDGSGRVVQADAGAGTSRYTYDAAGQLVAALTPVGTWTWAYDTAGRLVHEMGPDGATDYTYDDAHQLVAVAGPNGVTAFGYDAGGRRTEQSGPAGTRRFSWDGLGRLTGIDDDTRTREVDVDALGRLAAFDGTPFTWDAVGPVPELVTIGDREVVAAGGHPVGLAGPDGSVDWFGGDWQGSAAPVAGSGGGDGHARDPWGARTSPGDAGTSGSPGEAVQPGESGPGESGGSGSGAVGRVDDLDGGIGLGFLGELDLGGLTWLRNRLYDPATRAFVAPDPLPGVPGAAVAANPYHYANNDPVGMVDPLGLRPLSIDAYNDIRAQETGVQWGNIAMGALMVGSFFIPGGPIIATLVGAGMGMAPGIIQGVTTGEWDAGAIIKGGVVGGITGRLGFGMGGASSTLTGAFARGGLSGAASGVTSEAYDMLPLPGSDGQFSLENVALETVIGGATGGMGYRAGSGDLDLIPATSTTAPHAPLGLPAGTHQPLPANVFPATADEFTAQLGVQPSFVGTTPDGTPRTKWEPNSYTRITLESHPEGLSPGDPGFNPRHHGEHYHVQVRPTPTTGWNNSAVQKLHPPGYTPGSGTGFLPGEPFP